MPRRKSATTGSFADVIGIQGKFADPDWTAAGVPRAVVAPRTLQTLWFNTGTRCNLACRGCYIESSPRNDRLSYLTRDEVRPFLQEAERSFEGLAEIGFTGGEPFLNPEIIGMLQDAMAAGYRGLALTNAMAPLKKHRAALQALNAQFTGQLALRVSLDHFIEDGHEEVRGPGSWQPALEGLKWLSDESFDISVASRTIPGLDETKTRLGFEALFLKHRIDVDAHNPARLVIFPEMDESEDVPEISQQCWSILARDPGDVMCATSRMVVKRKGGERPVVVSCTLLPYDKRFEMGHTLADANRPVRLNHPYCAKFCVLGGASCSQSAAIPA
ncbi:radical SAM protein [Emcibacter sp. SYSU 3D8]|uniref:radical SAM protein n=1 Tax=Emcibacter sp. SYSU 3D8 TaxID=3133969 RepID=UPI0031FF2659